MSAMTNLYDLSLEALRELVQSWGFPAYRGKQIHEWLYKHKVIAFEQMTSLPVALREKLAAEAKIGNMEQVAEQHSSDGQTVKRLFRLPDNQLIESVLMEYDDGRRTACISTQAGCAMGCVFCATGQMGFARHLTTGEIVEQALHFARQLEREGDRLSNVVLMGMGEPLHNYDHTLEAMHALNDPTGLNIGQRHITVSTVGLVPQIRRFADEDNEFKLAISLHAASDEERSALLPINKRFPIREVIDAARYYVEKTGRRMTFEWALIRGENDTVEQAQKLGKLLQGLLCHVNLIPLNPTGGYDGSPSDPARVQAFQETLDSYGVANTVRVRRGIDIQAGCGQLKTEVLKRKGTHETATA
ncbi:MAG: 23S rRNA (adenine(2503)-C(2))-methyltransferase RlmN [Anaerolineae bacterium]|nr:23S rRNA (adenine(2503)-C(2))-methyltransferase RlmN [Anaerolineae bacterium]